jgi:hypothetical protein
MRVSWNAVTNANGYLVQYSSDSAFVNDVHAVMLDAPGASTTLSGIKPDTMYHIKVKALAFEGDTDSEFSLPYLVRSGIATGNETAMQLQNWLADEQSLFQNFATLLPQLETTELNTAARMRLLGSGVRRYGFIEKVFEVSQDYPQFWPPFGAGKDELNEAMKEIDVLRNLLVWFRYAGRVVQDLLLLAGDEAFRVSGAYYTLARDGARRRNPEAQKVFEMLQLFWQRPRRKKGTPTKKQALRNAKGLMNGTLEGEMFLENESDTTVKGKKTVVDKTRRKSKGGVKITESEELSAD